MTDAQKAKVHPLHQDGPKVGDLVIHCGHGFAEDLLWFYIPGGAQCFSARTLNFEGIAFWQIVCAVCGAHLGDAPASDEVKAFRRGHGRLERRP